MAHPGLTGIAKRPISLEAMFKSLTTPPLFVNDYDITKEEDKEKLNNLLYTRYQGETLDIVPSCECGEFRGEEYVETGIVCSDCGFEVEHITEKPLESLLWIDVPPGIDTFISTTAWRRLSRLLHIPSFSTMRYLTDAGYKSYTDKPEITRLYALKLPRGLNNFFRNFDSIIEGLITSRCVPLGRAKLLKLWVEKYRDTIFTTKMPVPSKLVFVIEKAAGSPTMYAENNMRGCIEAIRNINSIVHQGTAITERVKNRNVVDAIDKLAIFYKNYYSKNLGTKPGIFRKGLLGSRLDFTARAVASSMFDNLEREDSCILPWGVSCELFRIHLMNRLLRAPYNMTPNQATTLINSNIRTYNPILAELFDEFVGDGYKTYCIVQRN